MRTCAPAHPCSTSKRAGPGPLAGVQRDRMAIVSLFSNIMAFPFESPRSPCPLHEELRMTPPERRCEERAHSRRARRAAVGVVVLVVVSLSTSSAVPDRAAALGVTLDLAVEIEPVPGNTLAAVLRFESPDPTRASVRVVGPDHRFTIREDRKTQQHEIAVVGMRPERSYELTVELESAAADAVSFTTGSLPEDLPVLEYSGSPKRMAPGWTLFSLGRREGIDPASVTEAPSLGYLVAVDASGETVWYHETPSIIGDARLLDNGHILYEYADVAVREIDVLGRVVHEWAGSLARGRLAQDDFGRIIASPVAIPVETDNFHHEVGVLSNGNLIALSIELHTVDGFTEPQCLGESADQFTGTYQLLADVVVEFEPETGAIVNEWHIADLIEPDTDGLCSLSDPDTFPNFLYSDLGEVHDWTHGNGVVLDEERNALLVSLRHLDAVLALRYEADRGGPSGEVLWELGPNGHLELADGSEWQYHQHAPEVQDDGSLLIYDNGNDRPGTDSAATDPVDLPYSRAVLYKLRGPAAAPTSVKQVWEYRSTIDGVPAYAFFVGDADRLSNGNVLITNGGVSDHPSGVGIQIVEVEPRGRPGDDVVFEVRVASEDWFAYRAERVPALVPTGIARR